MNTKQLTAMDVYEDIARNADYLSHDIQLKGHTLRIEMYGNRYYYILDGCFVNRAWATAALVAFQ